MIKAQKSDFFRIKRLVKIYYNLRQGELIGRHTELLFLFKIKNPNHPHHHFEVYISRMSLKHFVERRKEEFSKNNSENTALSLIYKILDKTHDVMINFDSYKFELSNKHFYDKEYFLSPTHARILRILLEIKENRLEIISMHFRRK